MVQYSLAQRMLTLNKKQNVSDIEEIIQLNQLDNSLLTEIREYLEKEDPGFDYKFDRFDTKFDKYGGVNMPYTVKIHYMVYIRLLEILKRVEDKIIGLVNNQSISIERCTKLPDNLHLIKKYLSQMSGIIRIWDEPHIEIFLEIYKRMHEIIPSITEKIIDHWFSDNWINGVQCEKWHWIEDYMKKWYALDNGSTNARPIKNLLLTITKYKLEHIPIYYLLKERNQLVMFINSDIQELKDSYTTLKSKL